MVLIIRDLMGCWNEMKYDQLQLLMKSNIEHVSVQ